MYDIIQSRFGSRREPMEYISRFYQQRFRFVCISDRKHVIICDVPAEERTLIGNGFVQRLYNSRGEWRYSEPHWIGCPACGCLMKPKMFKVKARLTDKPCGNDCLSARGEECNCSCAGENHGLKYFIALSRLQVVELRPEGLPS